jgi:hypothetical protein
MNEQVVPPQATTESAAEPTPVQPDPAPVPQPNKIQQRIATLFGQAKEAQERAGAFEQQNQELRTQLLAVQDELATLRGQIVQPPSRATQTEVPSSSGLDVRKAVTEAVREAVGPVIKTLEQQRATEALRAQQRQSFERVISELPDLANPQSDLHIVADRVLRATPHLAAHPHAPELAAYLARGILADAPAPSAGQRLAASVLPAVSRGPAPAPTPQQELAALKTEYDAALEQGRTTEDQAMSVAAWVKRGQIAERMEALKKQHNLS